MYTRLNNENTCIYFVEFEVYLKSKIAELQEVQRKNLDNKLKNIPNFSAKSIDDSKASVYYTPTDGTFSPSPLQISPLHINYLNDNLDRNCMEMESPIHRKYYMEKKVKSVLDLVNEAAGGEEDILPSPSETKRSSNEDNCCVCIVDDDDDDDYSDGDNVDHRRDKVIMNRKNRHVSIVSNENDRLLINNVNVCDVNKCEGSRHCCGGNNCMGDGNGCGTECDRKRKRKRYFNKECYYSVESVFDNNSSLLCKTNQQSSDQCPVEKLNIIMDETGKTFLLNQCDNLLQTSASLPDIQNNTTVEIHTTTPHETEHF